jgi:hypothetical protein
VTERTTVNRRIILPLLAACLAIAVAVPVAAADEAGPLFAADGEGLEAMVDEYTSLARGLAEHLDEAGITYEVRDVPVVIWDFEDPAATEAVGEYLEGLGLPVMAWLDEFRVEGPFGGGFPFDGEPVLPGDVIDEMNARADELAAFLDDRDIGYEVEEGPGGVRFVIPDLSDPDAREALEEFWAEHGGPMFEVFEFDWEDDAGFHLHGPCRSSELRRFEGLGLLRELFGRA